MTLTNAKQSQTENPVHPNLPCIHMFICSCIFHMLLCTSSNLPNIPSLLLMQFLQSLEPSAISSFYAQLCCTATDPAPSATMCQQFMTNSRYCTLQQSSVNRRDQCVRLKVSLQNMSAGGGGFHVHVGSIASKRVCLSDCAALIPVFSPPAKLASLPLQSACVVNYLVKHGIVS